MVPNDDEELNEETGLETLVPNLPFRARRSWRPRTAKARGVGRQRNAAARASPPLPGVGVADWVLSLPSSGGAGSSLRPGRAPARNTDRSGWLSLLGDADWEGLI